MRLTGGTLRGRTLFGVLMGSVVRPTLAVHRERLFQMLDSGAWADFFAHEKTLSGARVLDVCAGSGSLGLEALSRGAQHVWLMERHPVVVDALMRSLERLRVNDRTTVYRVDATRPPPGPLDGSVDLLLCDPPYRTRKLLAVLLALRRRGWIDDQTLTVVQWDREDLHVLPGWDDHEIPSWCRDHRVWGRTAIVCVDVAKLLRASR